MKGKLFEFAMKHPIITLFLSDILVGGVLKGIYIIRTGKAPGEERSDDE